jgi:signal transduction histidine kinase
MDVGMFLENLARTTQPTAVRKRLSLRPMVEKDLPLIAVDPEKFEKVVLNLLSNAVKFTPGGGSILMVAQREGDSVRIRVSDSGIGIGPEVIPHLFERFSQADGSSQRRFGGTGLGLTLVKEFTEAHGGRVEVESTQGEGSSFSVIFPIGDPDTPLAPPAHSEVGDATQSTIDLEMSDSVDEGAADPSETQRVPEGMQDAPLILVADDNADMCRFMTDALRAEYRVVTAADGIRALRIAKERKPDLLILDIMMPGINGIELVRRLREDSATSRTPVIMVTARVGLDQKIEGMKVGANDYMYKPFSVAELRARIAGLLRQGRMERALGARNEELAAKNLRLEDLVIHQEKLSALGELLAGTAHELATPITYMASNARTLEGYVRDLETYVKASRASGQGEENALEQLARKLDLDGAFEELEDLVRGFMEGGTRASELLKNLRTYSRQDEQRSQETDLRACISSSLHLLTGHTRGRIRVHRDDDPDLPPVRCIEGQVKQVIVNLVSNAIQAIEGEGDVWISTRYHPGGTDPLEVPCVEISLRDSGKGIPLHLQEEIFRPFVTTKEEARGSGLGLPITRDIVDRHGGRILFESRPGAGTTFVVFLPLSPPSGRPEGPR